MSELIDRQALIKQLKDENIPFNADINEIINMQPIAYDVGKVINELRKKEICTRCVNQDNSTSHCATFCDLGKKLEFIRNGGVENG